MARAVRDGVLARYACPVNLTLDVIGRKWEPLILCALYEGPLHYNTLQAALPGVAHKVLTQQLRSLERNGIIQRLEQRDRAGHRVQYRLTALGRTLRPVLRVMARWANANHRAVGAVLDVPPTIRKRIAAVS